MSKTYEAMFLLDAGPSDFEAASAPVRDVLARIEAEVIAMKPWDERRLAYPVEGRKRGLYVLTYFRAAPGRLSELHHEVQLSEQILRAMVLSGDHLTDEVIAADTPAQAAQARRAIAQAERDAKAQAEAKTEAKPEAKTEAKPDAKAEAPAAEAPSADAEKPKPAAPAPPAAPKAKPEPATDDTPPGPPADSKPDRPDTA